MKYTEKQLCRMASPISASEDEKCKNAIRMVRDALKVFNYTDDGKEIRTFLTESYSYALDLREQNSGRKITLLVQGSYANKTNIPTESDVDVAVILESTFITKYRPGVSGSNYGFIDGSFSARELKDEVESALNKHFGCKGVERHDKSIKVYGNTYRVDADVVPSYRYRDYSDDYSNDPLNYIGGIEIRPDSGGTIINYPEQHIKMGIEKNKSTKYNFKKCVRIIKSIKEQMEEHNFTISPCISSFGLESLLWNVDVSEYTKYPSVLRYTFDEVITFLKYDSRHFDRYKEANGIKRLFSDEKTKDAYLKFVYELNDFFEYDIEEPD